MYLVVFVYSWTIMFFNILTLTYWVGHAVLYSNSIIIKHSGQSNYLTNEPTFRLNPDSQKLFMMLKNISSCMSAKLTWDQALFLFLFVNKIPVGKAKWERDYVGENV